MYNEKYPHVTLFIKGANTLIMQEEQMYINSLVSSQV
jgi:bisphosphoglycerate-independent phosphoglycerate mutase (AlkP superfamily)